MLISTTSCLPCAGTRVSRVRSGAALEFVAALLILFAAPPALSEDTPPEKPAVWVCSRPEVPPLPSQPTARDVYDQNLRHRLRARECEIESRRRSEPNGTESCYFGPEFVRITNERYEEIRQAHKADPVELWHAILSEPEDPNQPPIEIRITSKSGPTCKSDYDRELQDEVDALTKELNVR